jgi:GT2 family glycosyltransferase
MKIILATPGRSYSNKFLISWTELLWSLFKRGIEVQLVNRYSSVVYYARNMCLGGDNLRGENQLPYQGQVDYDYIMWIDSDIVWSPEHFYKLLTTLEGYPQLEIVSGLYRMEDMRHYAAVVNWDIEYFKKNGTFKFMSVDDLKLYDKNTLIEVAYTGMGFTLIRRGVFEKVGYPWFRPIWENIPLDNGIVAVDFTSEDVGFCRTATEKGIKILVDPSIIVGHEKSLVI